MRDIPAFKFTPDQLKQLKRVCFETMPRCVELKFCVLPAEGVEKVTRQSKMAAGPGMKGRRCEIDGYTESKQYDWGVLFSTKKANHTDAPITKCHVTVWRTVLDVFVQP